jgi:hypothetical protein
MSRYSFGDLDNDRDYMIEMEMLELAAMERARARSICAECGMWGGLHNPHCPNDDAQQREEANEC